MRVNQVFWSCPLNVNEGTTNSNKMYHFINSSRLQVTGYYLNTRAQQNAFTSKL